MAQKKKKRKKRLTIKQKRMAVGLIIALVLVGVIYKISSSFAQPLENDVRVAENSDLTYYLDILYNGKDADVVTSSDTATAKVYSDYIHVEDRIPEGLIFKDFINTEDGTIGATTQKEPVIGCPGYVVDGYAGLKYDEATGLVSFKIKNLQAGCKITVGIKTTTPSLNGKKRMDFYNTAYARENLLTAKSNTVHVFMGREEASLYNVSYEYTGEIPENAPELPTTSSYAGGTTVGVEANPTISGYTFSGWTTEDVEVSNGSFTMPETNITFKGSFTKKETYTVTYETTGEVPKGYMPPKTKNYGEGDDVIVDSLKPGDRVGEYRFLGWTSDDVTLEEAKKDENVIFSMPNKNVVLTGSFELVKYKVTYQFQGAVVPPNAESLLPAEKEYKPGVTVTREEEPTATGYKFLGWYQNETFEMPESDVVIYGEWMQNTGSFAPTITKTIVDGKTYYANGEKVTFEITVTNTAAFAIKDILIQEKNTSSSFIDQPGYTVLSKNYVKIDSLAAGASIKIKAEYPVGEEAIKKETNEVEITGALAENGYTLDTTKDYKATTTFYIANIKLNIQKVGEENDQLEGAEFTLYEDSALTNVVGTGLAFTKLHPGTYYLKETKTPTGYQLLNKTLEVVIDDQGNVSIENYDVTNENGVASVTIANQKIDILPNTGGIGTLPFIIGGLIIIFGGITGTIYYYGKKRRKK